MQLIMDNNVITKKIYNRIKIGGVNGHRVKCEKSNSFDGFVYSVDDKTHDFDSWYGSGEDGKDPGYNADMLPGVFENIMFDLALECKRNPQNMESDSIDVKIKNNSLQGIRDYRITGDDITFCKEAWVNGFDGQEFEFNDLDDMIINVSDIMRERAFDGEFSEDTRMYLSDEEASDLLYKESNDFE